MNDTLLLGPTSLGEFLPVAVRGIHRKRMPVKEVRGGHTASFALKKVRRGEGSGCWEIAEGSRCEVLDMYNGGPVFARQLGWSTESLMSEPCVSFGWQLLL